MRPDVLYSAFRRSVDEGRLILRTTILAGERRLHVLDLAAVKVGGLFHVVGSDNSYSTTTSTIESTLGQRTFKGLATFEAFNGGLSVAIITTIARADGTSVSSVSFAGGSAGASAAAPEDRPFSSGRAISRLAERGALLVMGVAAVAGWDHGETIVSGFDPKPLRRAPVLVDGVATPEAWLAINELSAHPTRETGVYLEEPRLRRATPLREIGGYRAEGGRLVDAAELAQQAETVRAFAASRFVEARR